MPHQEAILNIHAIEADLCGTKILASSSGPTKEYLSNKPEYLENTDVFLAPPLNTRYRSFDSQEIADKIIFSSMKKDNGKIKKGGKTKKNLDKFSWEKVVPNWVEYL